MSMPSKPPSIGYVLRRFPTLSRTFVTNEVLALERLGYSVDILALRFKPGDTELNIPDPHRRKLHRLHTAGIGRWAKALGWLAYRHPIRLLRTLPLLLSKNAQYRWEIWRKAILVAHQAEMDGLQHLHAHLLMGTDVAWLAHRLSGIGFSFTAHSANIFVPAKTVLMGAELRDAAFAVTVCESNKRLMAEHAPETADKIQVIRPFLNLSLISRPPSPSFTDNNGPLRLVSVCRLVPKKGVDVLVRAVKLALERGIAVQLSIVGEGPERTSLTALIQELGLNQQISLLGAQPPSGVYSALAAAECFILAPVLADNGDSDATPTVLAEAMAVGLPVISTRLGGIPEIIPPGGGWLVDAGKPAGLADAIEQLGNMTAEQRRQMGAVGKDYVQAHWNCEQDAARLGKLFEQAAAA